jgi:Skp family chaperone for outer membrane proteins
MNRYLFQTIIFLSILFIFLNNESYAQGGKTSQIYVVDIQSVIDRSLVGKAANERIQREGGERETRIRKLQSDLQAFERSVQKQQALLSKEAFEERLVALDKKQKEVARAIADHREATQQAGNNALTKIVGRIQELMPKLAEQAQKKGQNGSPMILEKSPQLVVYIAPEYDLTEEMLKMLNNSNLKI